MSIFRTVSIIITHPLNKKNPIRGLFLFFKWQIKSRILRRKIVCNFGTKSKLLVSQGMKGATQNIYCGLQEFSDMGFLLHFLRDSDVFIDVGANIGSYTVLAASEIKTKTYAVEPVPNTYNTLLQNIEVNNISNIVTPLNICFGAKKDTIGFTKDLDTTNHVAIEGEKNIIEVQVETFDSILKIDTESLIKIDTEGFEYAVLQGMRDTLTNSFLKAIIIELNGLSKRYGYEDEDVYNMLLKAGFMAYSYDPFKRTLKKENHYGTHNTLFIRDLDFVKKRLIEAPMFNIHYSKF